MSDTKSIESETPAAVAGAARGSTTGWTVALCVCFVLEMLLWWKLNWNPWVLAATFVAGCRGSFLTRRRIEKESSNVQAHPLEASNER